MGSTKSFLDFNDFFDADPFVKTSKWVRKAEIKQTPKRMRHLIATSDLLCDENNEAISNTNKWSSRKKRFSELARYSLNF